MNIDQVVFMQSRLLTD